MITAYLGLGSNLGNRLAFLRGGRDSLLNRFDIVLLRASSVYETAAVGGPADNPPFLNAVLEVETPLAPRELLAACFAVEDEFGRTRPAVWAPRTLDIDLLLYGGKVVDEAGLQIPHPRLHERAFVLTPLNELNPDLLHPLLLKDIRSLTDELPPGVRPAPLRVTW
ncbi:MAG: 2-amino-4-hydroxy-6-hydroxymethyldihydropteridine diphosphokinase [Desulfuromonadales bacterium]|nr:2-amino-4-hydroxy-6-hydroxymethyldihydropteridine diphosphokinase [Desulfuromonadales bacterium]